MLFMALMILIETNIKTMANVEQTYDHTYPSIDSKGDWKRCIIKANICNRIINKDFSKEKSSNLNWICCVRLILLFSFQNHYFKLKGEKQYKGNDNEQSLFFLDWL